MRNATLISTSAPDSQRPAPDPGQELGELARAVAEQLPAELAVRADDLADHWAWILAAVRGEVSSAPASGASLTLRRRLIDRIRTEFLRRCAEDPPPLPHVLAVFEALERAQRACTPNAEQSFSAELADHGGLDLVVEVAHDMRSPLTSILFLSEILHSGQSGPINEVQKRQIGIVYSAALGLVGLASDMIEMARGGNRLRTPEPSPFSVNELLRGVHDLVRPTAEEKKLDVVIHELPTEHRIGHPVPLSRVLLNMTTNALKFTHEGRVEVSAEEIGGSRVRFSVRDTGPGISGEAMAQLYQPFRREPRRESGYAFSGTGLGLAICKRLVDALGSELHVESGPDWGTRFTFEIDLPPASAL